MIIRVDELVSAEEIERLIWEHVHEKQPTCGIRGEDAAAAAIASLVAARLAAAMERGDLIPKGEERNEIPRGMADPTDPDVIGAVNPPLWTAPTEPGVEASHIVLSREDVGKVQVCRSCRCLVAGGQSVCGRCEVVRFRSGRGVLESCVVQGSHVRVGGLSPTESPYGRDPVPPEVHEREWQWRPTDSDTAFAPPFGTIRACRVCGCLVVGGPTACVRCAKQPQTSEADTCSRCGAPYGTAGACSRREQGCQGGRGENAKKEQIQDV